MPADSQQTGSLLRVLLTSAVCTSLLAIGYTVVASMVGDRSAAEKTATALVLPAGLIGCLLLCSVIFFSRLKQRSAAVLATIMLAVFYILSSSYTSTWLSHQLEAPWTGTRPLEEGQFDAVVVLGGGVSAGGNGRSQGNSAGDRLILAAQMYHAGQTDRIICTGRRIKSMSREGDRHPSERALELLQNLGVPESALEMSGGRTTAEEMKSLGQRFDRANGRIGLITSAWHMNRALRLAHRCEFQPVGLPAGFLLEDARGDAPLALKFHTLIPSADAMHNSSMMLKEYLAMLAGR